MAGEGNLLLPEKRQAFPADAFIVQRVLLGLLFFQGRACHRISKTNALFYHLQSKKSRDSKFRIDC